jgi:hypothetical protein
MGGHVTDCAATCVADDGELCGACWEALAVRLREVPGLVDELETTITRQDKLTANRVGSRGTETPLPFNGAASMAKTHLRYFLGSWARDVAERSGGRLPAWPRERVATEAAMWLLDHQHAVRHHPAADDLCEELSESVWAAVRAIDRPAERVFAGWCCTALYARPGADTVTCRVCETEQAVDEARRGLLALMPDQKGSSTEVSGWLALAGVRVPSGTIRRWAHEGRIPRHGGAYRVGDVLGVVSDTLAA